MKKGNHIMPEDGGMSDEEIDRIQENTNSIDSQVNGRIDRHLEGHPTR